jgi:hypothetical protein
LLIVAFAPSTETGERMLVWSGAYGGGAGLASLPTARAAAPNTILPESMFHRISRCRVGKMRIRENPRTAQKF